MHAVFLIVFAFEAELLRRRLAHETNTLCGISLDAFIIRSLWIDTNIIIR